jgi:ribonuclease HI
MPSKFYVVWVGRETGVFTSWLHTKKQVHNFPQAKFKSFKTQEAAEIAYTSGRDPLSNKSAKSKAKTSSNRTNTGLTTSIEKQFDSEDAAKKIFDLEIYCDGACDPNPGEAGSGVAVYRGGQLTELWYGLYSPHGTNNSAELNALYKAFQIAKEGIAKGNEVQVLCDSQYSINCVTNWAFGWEKKGWKRKTEGDIKNLKIIQQAHQLYKSIRAEVRVSHVKGHMGIEGNELADRMAAFGVDQQATDFCRYTDTLEVEAILNFRTG